MFAVALHRQLLEVSGEPFQVLLVRQNRNGLRAKKITVPDCKETHYNRQVALEWRSAKVLIHFPEPVEHGAEIVRANSNHCRQANR